MLLRCSFCSYTPAKARQDGCPLREVHENGHILLSEWNPDGKARFMGRACMTCDRPIMGHWLRRGSPEYFCFDGMDQVSDGLKPVPVDDKEYWPNSDLYQNK